MFFNCPEQVIFVDDELLWSVGIAYKNEIICCCCGRVFSIEKVQEYGKEKGVKNAIHLLEWTDIGGEIRNLVDLENFKDQKIEKDLDWFNNFEKAIDIFREKVIAVLRKNNYNDLSWTIEENVAGDFIFCLNEKVYYLVKHTDYSVWRNYGTAFKPDWRGIK